MGYRSEVGFCLQVKEPEKFVALLKLRTDDATKEMMEYMYLVNGLINFHHGHWKWYDDSQKALDEIMDMAESYDENMSCKFARYGEESDDVVEDAWGDNGWDLEYPYVVRSLELGFNPNTAKKLIEEESNVTTE
jgi:ribonuclease HI